LAFDDAAKNFDKAHNIDRLCASKGRLLAPMCKARMRRALFASILFGVSVPSEPETRSRLWTRRPKGFRRKTLNSAAGYSSSKLRASGKTV
jgi:hypothetical protein